MAKSFTMIEESSFEELVESVHSIQQSISGSGTSADGRPNRIYTNEAVKSLLGIGDKTLKKLRDSNLLPYHLAGKEYWYQQADLDYLMDATKVSVTNI